MVEKATRKVHHFFEEARGNFELVTKISNQLLSINWFEKNGLHQDEDAFILGKTALNILGKEWQKNKQPK